MRENLIDMVTSDGKTPLTSFSCTELKMPAASPQQTEKHFSEKRIYEVLQGIREKVRSSYLRLSSLTRYSPQ